MNELTLNNNAIKSIDFSNDYFKSFIDYCDVKETTLNGYIAYIKQFMRWLNDNEINQPVREDIKSYKAYLDKQNLSAGTKAQYLRAVKHFFKWTQSEGFYPNIADNIKGIKVHRDNTKKEAFNEEDIKTILRSIDRTTEAGKRDYAMILLSVTGGLRIIEMQRADIQDIATIKGQRVLYIQGKGHEDKDDYTKLIPEVAEAIADYLASRPPYKNNSPLFTGTSNRGRGQRMSVPTISRIIKKVFINAGYDSSKLTAHSLRHTSNTLLFKSGADLTQVQKHARHSDPSTTQIYLHAFEREKDTSEQDIFNQIFKPSHRDSMNDAIDLFKSLSGEELEKAYDFIKRLSKGCKTV